MENGINEREVYSENYEKDKEAIKRQCTFLSENSNLFYRYLDELLDLTTGLPMYQAEYPEEKFFCGQDFVYDLLFSLLDTLQECGIGILIPEFLRRKLRSMNR